MADRTQAGRLAVSRIIACDTEDHYGILGLDFAAESSTIIKAYQKLSLLVHPDKCKAPNAEEAMKRLNNSKEYLTNPILKAKYDRRRASGKMPGPARGSSPPRYDPESSRGQRRGYTPGPEPNPDPWDFRDFDDWFRGKEESFYSNKRRNERREERREERRQRTPPRATVTNVSGDPTVVFEVIPTGKVTNSFWRAFALALHDDANRWAEVKVQVGDFFLNRVLADRSHPRWVLYNALNKEAKEKRYTSLRRQLLQANEKATPELYQVLADLFSVELMVVHDNKDMVNSAYTMIPRGQHGDLQVFLQRAASDRYHVLEIKSEREDEIWSAHMSPHGQRSPDERRCPLPGWNPNGKKFSVPEMLDPWPEVEIVDPDKVRRWTNDRAAQR
ncbi:MAG: hypothetical protein M1836_005942 [Candelina mexicana]|nr:MAG: hypothetical protein M1836_005942 [Candelina mexicana]